MTETTKLQPVENYKTCNHVFYEKGQNHVYDFAYLFSNGQRLTCNGESIEQVLERNPGREISIMTYDEAAALIEKVNEEQYSVITETTEERYNEMLSVLPPSRWGTSFGVTSFLVPECVTGRWYAGYAQIGDRFFSGYCNIAKETTDEFRIRMGEYSENH